MTYAWQEFIEVAQDVRRLPADGLLGGQEPTNAGFQAEHKDNKMTQPPTLTDEADEIADFIRDQVCCPRIHGCEVNGAEECPAERVRTTIAALQAQVKALREGLEPFAKAASHLHPSQPDDGLTLDAIEVRHWRRAAQLLSQGQDNAG